MTAHVVPLTLRKVPASPRLTLRKSGRRSAGLVLPATTHTPVMVTYRDRVTGERAMGVMAARDVDTLRPASFVVESVLPHHS